jgi:hypothetical protein
MYIVIRFYFSIETWVPKLSEDGPTLILSIASLIVSLLIPVAILLLDTKVSENVSENRWAKKVLKKQIIHFNDVLNCIIFIIVLTFIEVIFPKLIIFSLMGSIVAIFILIKIVRNYIKWIDIDGLGNDTAIADQKRLLTSPQYPLNEQSYYWQLFLDYGCSLNKNSMIFNPETFYQLWKKAASNYKNQSSPDFYSFCSLLANAIPKLKLNFGSSFEEKFYKYCIENYLKADNISKRNWDLLTSALTSYVQKKVANQNESFSYYRCVRTLDNLVNKNLENTISLDYINKQFLKCVLSCRDPQNVSLNSTCFQITSDDFNKDRNNYKQAFSLMKQFIHEIKQNEYHNSIDTAINMIFPRANVIAIGRLDYLINCTFNLGLNTTDDLILDIINILKGTPKFGYISRLPNFQTDISDFSKKEINTIENFSYLEGIKIYAGFYQNIKGVEILESMLKKIVKTMRSNKYLEILSNESNSSYLKQTSKVYADILEYFLEFME